MKNKKILIVVGTRPEAIKLAPVIFSLRARKDATVIVLSTGQHREMLEQALGVFGITPDISLGVMRQGQTLAELTARLIQALDETMKCESFDIVVGQGDTTTAFTSALVAFYKKIPFAHVEAGLRTRDMAAPWPEEMNRRLISPISRWSFAPTNWSRMNLLSEGIDEKTIFVTGNTVVDALLWVRKKHSEVNPSMKLLAQRYGIPTKFEDQYLSSSESRLILVTGHRRESFGEGFARICKSISDLVERHDNVGVLYPVHLNPSVRNMVYDRLGNNERICLIPPTSYEDFIILMDRSYIILSDSGGVQEEAPTLGKPLLIMREVTERPEGVAAGTSVLVGTNTEKILSEVALLLADSAEYSRRSGIKNPYGNGNSAENIANILMGS